MNSAAFCFDCSGRRAACNSTTAADTAASTSVLPQRKWPPRRCALQRNKPRLCCAAPDERRPLFAILSIPNSVAFIALIERPVMKKNSSSMTARATIGALFLVIGVFLIAFALSTTSVRSAAPNSGTLNPAGPTVSWAGTAAGGGSLDCIGRRLT
jgi:hypothetical protein